MNPTQAPNTPIERWLSTIMQVIAAFVLVLPAALSQVDGAAGPTAWILGIAAATVIVVNGVWNAVSSAIPTPHRRLVRTVVHVVVAICVATPAAVAAVGEPAGATGWLIGILGAVVVILSAVRNAIAARSTS
jgi:predicted membrane channel-forming protein YqfA (hemolysin III family)